MVGGEEKEIGLERLNSLRKAVRKINQLIVRSSATKELARSACAALIETRGYMDIAISFRDQGGSTISPVAHRGRHDRRNWEVELPPEEDDSLPRCVEQAVCHKRQVLIENTVDYCQGCFHCRHGKAHRSVLTPLTYKEKLVGVLFVCLRSERSIDEGELELLKEVGDDLALGWSNILVEKQNRRRSIAMESAVDGIAILNEEEEYVYLNGAHAQIYGYDSSEELVGKNWKVLYEEEEAERIEREGMSDLYRRGYWRGEATGLRKDGTTFPQEVALTALEDGGLICVVRDITERERTARQLQQSFVELAETTSRVLGVRDPYTQQHEQRVAELAREVGERMELDEEELLGLYLGGMLHDIGKIAIPETILTKPGELSDIEWDMIRSHPRRGHDEILEETDFPWPVAEMTLHHHERLDGSGYPDGLEGEELSFEVRVIGACDVVEAMSTRRPYRAARSKERVLDVLGEGRGIKFDPQVTDILFKMVEQGEIEFD